MSSFEFFAPCPRGLEAALAAELRDLGAHAAITVGADVPGGVHFSGEWSAAMAANLHSRIASRVLLKIAARPYRNEHDIFAFALEQPWERWFTANQTLRIDVTAIKSPLRSLEFTTLKVKDAVCDRLRDKTGARPNIDTAEPDVRIFVFVTATDCTLYLDTSGEPLFKRGWRLDKGAAPLRENLAAGILRLTGWTPDTPLYDPMCGSGTFLAEAVQQALGVAPGVQRRFGFEKLKSYDITAWQTLKVAAMDKARAARGANVRDLPIFGSDISGDMLEKARANLARAGVPTLSLKQLDARNMIAPSAAPGILVANPPYGERIEVRGRGPRGEARPTARSERGVRGERGGYGGNARGDDDDAPRGFERAHADELGAEFFLAFGSALKQHFAGWRAFMLTSDRGLPGQLRLRESTKTPLYNGALECRLFRFDVVAGPVRRRDGDAQDGAAADH
ncbi:THUMP domain-containing class I SAM-dependent RNA methyltransferase [Pararobbsia silviterrae]|uniref:Class I SAM-dependent RNA methyltransferase n=1 Tax=Pararobbsia silviterrae TaxID=1792498 RepID=A0A494XCV0_9BURK|nr:class I SAM-dependent RNA methyltransferase [Pararobbsia silviterrae]RKP48585.1 class I SAM-dependent RNA methyltransferase [Pararobbsia silviterrae]